jgi:hypothetical protein
MRKSSRSEKGGAVFKVGDRIIKVSATSSPGSEVVLPVGSILTVVGVHENGNLHCVDYNEQNYALLRRGFDSWRRYKAHNVFFVNFRADATRKAHNNRVLAEMKAEYKNSSRL